MTWTLDTSTLSVRGTDDPFTLQYTCASSAELLVLAIFVDGNTTRTGGAPTYNGDPMTDSGQGFVVHTECGVEVWYLINPDTGAEYTISIPNTNTLSCIISAASFIPSAGGCVYDNSNSATGETQDPSLSLTVSATGNLIFGALGSGDRDVPTAGANFTLIHTEDIGNQTWGSEYDLAGSATPVTVDFGTARADDWGLIGISFAEIVGDINIDKSGANGDDIQVTDSVTVDVSDPQVNISDNTEITDSVTVQITTGVNVRDDILLADTGPNGYINKVLSIQPNNLLAYWPLNETSGTNADNAEGTATRDGTYTGVDLNQIAGPDLNLLTEGDHERAKHAALLDPIRWLSAFRQVWRVGEASVDEKTGHLGRRDVHDR